MPPRHHAKGRRSTAAGGAVPLQRARHLGARLLEGEKDVVYTLQELSAAEGEVAAWIKKADTDAGKTPGVWAAVGDEGFPGLHASYAIALRRSCAALEPSVNEPLRAAYASLRTKLSSELGKVLMDEGKHMPAGMIRNMGYAIMRAQALRCHAALLVEAAARLPSPGQTPDARPARSSRRSVQAAAAALTEARQLLLFFQELLNLDGGDEDLVSNWTLITTLAAELKDSHLLEQWSRVLLLLNACEGWESEAASQLHSMSTALVGFEPFLGYVNMPWRRALLLSSPCLSYLLSSHVVGLCAALDGGPTYGMPVATGAEEGEAASGAAAAAFAVTALVYTPSGQRLRQRSPSGEACCNLARWTLAAWTEAIEKERRDLDEFAPGNTAAAAADLEDEVQAAAPAPPSPTCSLRDQYRNVPTWLISSDPDLPPLRQRIALTATPPLHTAATFEVCMRLAAAATEAMSTFGSSALQLVVTRGRSRDAQLRVPAVRAPALAVAALLCGRQALGLRVTTASADLDGAEAARLRRWWAALAAVADAEERQVTLAGIGPRGRLQVDRLLDPPAAKPLTGLPPSPSPCVVAALQAGFLPRLIRMLRSIAGTDTWLSLINPSPPSGTEYAWDQLMAFSPPHAAAALVDALAALLRRIAGAVPAAGLAGRGTDARESDEQLMLGFNLYNALSVIAGVHRRALAQWAGNVAAAAAEAAQPAPATAAAEAGAEVDHQGNAAVGQAPGPSGSSAADGAHGSATTGSAVPAAGVPRLGLLLSYAAAHLLPVMARTLLDHHLHILARNGSYRAVLKPMLADLLTWATLLAAALRHARDQEQEAHQHAAASTAAAVAGEMGSADAGVAGSPVAPCGNSGDAAEWERLLISADGLNLPALLGTAVGLLKAGLDRDGSLELAGKLCCAMATLLRLLPSEVMSALGQAGSRGAVQAATAVATLYPEEKPANPRQTSLASRFLTALDTMTSRAGSSSGGAAGVMATQQELEQLAQCGLGPQPGVGDLLGGARHMLPPSRLQRALG